MLPPFLTLALTNRIAPSTGSLSWLNSPSCPRTFAGHRVRFRTSFFLALTAFLLVFLGVGVLPAGAEATPPDRAPTAPETPRTADATDPARPASNLAARITPMRATSPSSYTTARSAATPASSTIMLPILVYADDGRSAHVESVTLSVSDPTSVDSLYVQAHQPFYHVGGMDKGPYEGFDVEGAAEIRINGGAWVPVRDENVDCAWPESAYDCIGGPMATVRFMIPSSDVVAGDNTIEFKFNGTDGVRSGYRVLGVGFMRQGDPNVQSFDPKQHGAHDGTSFTYGGSTQWAAPNGYDDASSIAEGKKLFQEAELVELTGEKITATCASCHARDGRDLQYFGYSNRTITSRSRAHGLSAEQGRKIAAYIRSIQIRTSTGTAIDPPGTPWDPPYQPGPEGFGPDGRQGADDADPVYWAAGAGLEWVLDDDEESLPYVFPKNGDPALGIDYNADGSLNWQHVNLDSQLNMREIPIALQLPDWNNWLPDIHPADYIPDRYNGSQTVDHVDQMYAEAATANDDGDYQDMDRLIRLFNKYFRQDGLNGGDRPSGWSGNKHEQAELGAYLWKLVRVWDVQHSFFLEDKADDAWCGHRYRPYCESRGWLSRARHAFDPAPHISAPSGMNELPAQYGGIAGDFYYTHAWYHLQVIVNPGTDPRSSGQVPVDWGYQEAFLSGAAGNYGVGAGVRQFTSEIKNWQMFSNGYYVDGTGGDGYNSIQFRRGWNPQQSDFDRLIEAREPDAATWSNLSWKQRELLVEAGLRAWHDYVKDIPPSDFPRSTSDKKRYEASDYVPQLGAYTTPNDYAQKIYQSIAYTAEDLPGVSRGVLDSLALWGDDMWPDDVEDYPGQPTKSWPSNDPDHPRWDELVDYTPPTPGRHDIRLTRGWNLISSHVKPKNSSIEAIFSDFIEDVVIVKSEMGETFIPAYTINTIKSWKSDEAYMVYVRADHTLTIEGSKIDASSTLPIERGWNLVPYYPQENMTPEEAFASLGNDLVMVKDYSGAAYIPEYGLDDIDTLRVGQGYKMYVEKSASLTYPSLKTSGYASSASQSASSGGGTSASANVVARVPHLPDGTPIVARDGGGEVVGRGSVQSGSALLNIRGDDPLTNVVEGVTSGETLVLSSSIDGTERPLDLENVREVFSKTQQGSITYEKDALWVATSAEKPVDFQLRGNYPNPVQTRTKIEFSVPESVPVRIEVFNVLGQRVATLTDETYDRGWHSVDVNASRYASGVYFYRIEAGGFRETGKMTVVQ